MRSPYSTYSTRNANKLQYILPETNASREFCSAKRKETFCGFAFSRCAESFTVLVTRRPLIVKRKTLLNFLVRSFYLNFFYESSSVLFLTTLRMGHSILLPLKSRMIFKKITFRVSWDIKVLEK